MLISDKRDVKPKLVKMDKGCHMSIKSIILQEDTEIVNMHSLNSISKNKYYWT
jgi:hypothetical protein